MSDDFVKKEFTEEEISWHNQEEALRDEMGITDANDLRKQMLSADEAVCAKGEEIVRIRQNKNRKDNWLEFIDQKARMGRVMSGHDILRLLRVVVPKIKAYDGRVRGTYGLAAPTVKMFDDGVHPGWQYLGWIYTDWNPEYTIDYVDEAGTPTGNRQGWRTLLLRGITLKDGTGEWTLKGAGVVMDGTGLPLNILTEASVDRVFGPPSGNMKDPGRSSYRRQLWRFRHGLRGDFDHTTWF